MAALASFSPCTIIHQSVPLKKSIFGVAMCRKSQLPVKKTVKLQIRSSVKNLVFEDHATGIICYKDDSVEIICEGYDEGPRLVQPPTTRHMWCTYFDNSDILDRLKKRWMQIIDGQPAHENGLLEEHRFNGLNALH